MKKIIIAMVLLIAGLLLQTVNAQGKTYSQITKNQIQEQQRIKEGMRTGELTPREAKRLELQQTGIERDKKMAKLDGVISPCERAYLKSEQAKAAKNIYAQKHDAQRW